MTAVQAIYDGQVFIPERPCDIISGSKVTLNIETVINSVSEKNKKLAAFIKLTNEINELNKTDPLPPEFNEIMSQRLHFREIPAL
jgi:predicted DNA-binding antitoxin AbrB/MazE fold protein